MQTLYTLSGIINTFLLVALTLGGIFAFRSGKKQAVVNIQRETIDALQTRISALEARQRDLEKENDHLRFVLETIKEALSKENIGITIDGDMVTIDRNGRSSSLRRRPPSEKTKP